MTSSTKTSQDALMPHVAESVGGTGDIHSVAQLLRLPSRSGLGVRVAQGEEPVIDGQALSVYGHQVGGHALFVKPLNSAVVLKPYDEQEFRFYDQCVPSRCPRLFPFTARCFGEVDLREKDDESRHLSESSASMARAGHGGQGGTPMDGVSMTTAAATKQGKYVMLEDLAHGLLKPCILDLKMGLKQRSVRNVSARKLASTEAKSLQTTSHRIGFRLCGAQLYDRLSPEPIFYNKYFGRLQDAAGTHSVLNLFFSSIQNEELKIRVLEIFISKLESLRSVIRQLPGFRFWSGSLLFVFDSSVDPTHEPSVTKMLGSVTLKMIDFANAVQVQSSTLYDFEYEFGVSNLITFLQSYIEKRNFLDITNSLPSPPDVNIQDRELSSAVARSNSFAVTATTSSPSSAALGARTAPSAFAAPHSPFASDVSVRRTSSGGLPPVAVSPTPTTPTPLL